MYQSGIMCLYECLGCLVWDHEVMDVGFIFSSKHKLSETVVQRQNTVSAHFVKTDSVQFSQICGKHP